MKKIISILLLLVATTYAKTAPDSKQAIENAKLVIEKDWSEAKNPLKKFIENDGEKYIKSFLKIAKMPMNPPKIKYEIPKILYTIDDCSYALSYAKYLESKNQISKAIPIYIEILKGLKKIDENKDIAGFIKIIVQIVMEDITTKALNSSIKQGIYSKLEKQQLLSELKNILIFDKSLWSKSMKYVRLGNNQLCNEHMASVNNDTNLTTEFLCKKVDERYELFYKLLGSVDENDKEWDIFMKKFLEERKRLEDSYSSLSPQEVAIYTFYYKHYPHLRATRRDFLDMIIFNKKLLKSLE